MASFRCENLSGPDTSDLIEFAYAFADASTDIAALRAELDVRRAACIDAFNY